MINAIVLAAGESQRMGKPKPLLRFQDKTFLEHIVTVLQEVRVDRVTVVLGARAEVILEAIELRDVDVTVNRDYERGQLSSLIWGLKGIPMQAEAILLCLVDHPFLTIPVVNRVIDAFKQTNAPIVIPTYNRKRGHPTLFSHAVFDQLISASMGKGARQVVHSNEDKVHEVPVSDSAILTGVNTPDQYRSHFGEDP
jgi:molybdenum cofactor cytidylyltransferase